MNSIREKPKSRVLIKAPGDKTFPFEIIDKFACIGAVVTAAGAGCVAGSENIVSPEALMFPIALAAGTQMYLGAKNMTRCISHYDDSARTIAHGIVYGAALGSLATVVEYESIKFLAENYF